MAMKNRKSNLNIQISYAEYLYRHRIINEKWHNSICKFLMSINYVHRPVSYHPLMFYQRRSLFCM